jgi:hypothetical protein
MNAVHLMGVKPKEVRQSLAPNLVGVIQGNRATYNAFHRRHRRGEIKESDSEEEPNPPSAQQLIHCSEVGCGGGGGGKKPTYREGVAHSEAQTTPIDLTHYYGKLGLYVFLI